jgi:hypothetical protein
LIEQRRLPVGIEQAMIFMSQSGLTDPTRESDWDACTSSIFG